MKTSIIVASKNASRSIRANLKSLLEQVDINFDEILLVDASTDGTAEIVRQEFPTITFIEMPSNTLIPQLWSAGLKQAGGDILAITTAHCLPEKSWLKAAQTVLLDSSCSAVGGAIINSPTANIVDSAVYFCRYWRYMLPFQRQETEDLPGDNAAYRRSDLFIFQDYFQDGFWEPFINARMKEKKLKMVMCPEMIVSHYHSFGILSFSQNRSRHGYHYGKDRSKNLTRSRKLIYFLASPIIPFLYLKRIFTVTGQKNLPRNQLLRCLPLMIVFLTAWAIGEASAYLKSALS